MTSLNFDINTTILTPNRRLAATLHKRYQQQQIHLGHQSWETPDILPISSWIQRLWLESQLKNPSHIWLNATQEKYLWESLIRQSNHSHQLLQIPETADLVKSAWELIKQWRIDIEAPIFNSAEDYAAFYRWAHAFDKICRENGWIDTASIPDLITDRIRTGDIVPNNKIVLVGFTEISPQIKELLKVCGEKTTTRVISEQDAPQPAQTIVRLTLEDNDTEILFAARWAKSVFDAEKDAMIGCVVPNLEKTRDRVIQVFSTVFEFSAGKRLTDFPIIHTALLLLNMNKKQVTSETMSYLLASPFLGGAENERMKRAYVDRTLRQNNVNHVDLDQAATLFSSAPLFAALISQFIELIDTYNDKNTYKNWAYRVNNLLKVLGWPGERSVNSEEYQTVDAWFDALNELATLDYVAKPCHLQDALFALKRIVMDSIFQPKTPDARVQVLGLLEAAGSPYDYLLVGGMDDQAWPPQPGSDDDGAAFRPSPPRPPAPRPAPDQRDGGVALLARRLAALEKRLAALETGIRGSGRGAQPKPKPRRPGKTKPRK